MTIDTQGHAKPLVRIWDRDFNNCIYEGRGQVGEVIGDLFITVDDDPTIPNWRTRTGGRIASVSIVPHTENWTGTIRDGLIDIDAATSA